MWAEGRTIRRGIVREFPIRYRDRHGDRVTVDFEVLDVQRDGRPEPWFTEWVANGVAVNTGNDDLLPVPARHAYVLRYRTARQLGFFETHDELYFNAIGHGSRLRVGRGSVTVRLPGPAPIADMQLDGFTGPVGMRGRDFRTSLPGPGVAHWELTAPLAPREGLTLVLGFPKGLVQEPGAARRLAWRLMDNRAGIVALAGLLLLLAYCIRRWRAIGRDPHPGTIIVRYEPPEKLGPAELRYLQRRRHDNTAFSADLLAAAVHGALTIHREGRALRGDRWTLRRGPDGAAARSAGALSGHLLEQLLPREAPELELHRRNAERIRNVMKNHQARIRSRIVPDFYRRNSNSLAIAGLMLLLTCIATLLTVSLTGSGLLVAIPLLLAAVATTVAFGFVIGAPTEAGRRLLDEIKGFRRYLSVAEQQDLRTLRGPSQDAPELDAGRFQRLLPYAVALDVEDAWTRKFTAAAGAAAAAAATASISWYSATGRGMRTGDLGGMTRALSQGFSLLIASSSSPPGSSSGGGSAGFSGGGSGGGSVGGR